MITIERMTTTKKKWRRVWRSSIVFELSSESGRLLGRAFVARQQEFGQASRSVASTRSMMAATGCRGWQFEITAEQLRLRVLLDTTLKRRRLKNVHGSNRRLGKNIGQFEAKRHDANTRYEQWEPCNTGIPVLSVLTNFHNDECRNVNNGQNT